MNMGLSYSNCCPEWEPPLSQEKKREIIRFFMIGTGATGKTTVIRQLKCLCKERPSIYKVYDTEWNPIAIDDIFSRAEMASFRRTIRTNITTAIYNLIQQTIEWGRECQHVENVEAITNLVEGSVADGRNAFDMDVQPSLKEDLLQVLRDPNIVATLKMQHKMSRKWRLEDGTLNFLYEDEIERLFDDDVELTTIDIVHLRFPTTDAQDFRFGIKGIYIQIHDMGGQPTEMMRLPAFMRNWIRSDRDGYKNFLLFVTSMADFNIKDDEEPTRTAMDRSLKIFERILEEDAIQNCGVLIFFNKQDRFDQIVAKLMETDEGRNELIKHLGDTLKEGSKRSVSQGNWKLKWMHAAVATKYQNVVNRNHRRSGGRGVYTRYTQAVDPEIMAGIFNVILNEIVNHFIENFHFIV